MHQNAHAGYARCLALLLGASATAAAAADSLVVNNAGDGPGACPSGYCTLRAAIAVIGPGGTITFDPAILPAVISLQQGALSVTSQLTIAGPGADLLTIDGNLASRLIAVGPFGTPALVLSGVSLINGRSVAGNGAAGAAGTGQPGGSGAFAKGGCIDLESGSLLLERVSMRNCSALGGNGGNGGSGTATATKFGGVGGAGGAGGIGAGGAIYASQFTRLVLSQTSIVGARASGGNGGSGGAGGSGDFSGNGGVGGRGGNGQGGAIFVDSGYLVHARNLTLAQSSAAGGKGGSGGAGDSVVSASSGGDGGNGGYAEGGLFDAIFITSSAPTTITFGFSTFAEPTLTPGVPGSGGRGATPGSSGNVTGGLGAAVASAVLINADKSAIFGTSTSALCFGQLFGTLNFIADGSCQSAAQPDLANWFKSLPADAAMPAYRPRFDGPAIDRSDCIAQSTSSFPAVQVAVDTHGTARPQGAACDVGAVEADYVFVGGFD